MRTCGSCTLCCKVMAITALKKPMNKWCEFCDKGTGCKIYPTRPSECRTFDCLWLSDENFPDEFKPLRSKIVFTVEHGGRRVSAHVDAAFPARAWQEKKLYASAETIVGSSGAEEFPVVGLHRHREPLRFCPTVTSNPRRRQSGGQWQFPDEKNRTTGRIEVTVGAVPRPGPNGLASIAGEQPVAEMTA